MNPATAPKMVVEVEQDYGELLENLQHALEWARGEREVRTFTRSTDDALYSPADALEVETVAHEKFTPVAARDAPNPEAETP